MEAIGTALITGLCMAIPQIYSTYKQNQFNKKSDKKDEAMKKAIVSILRSQIVNKCETYRKKGYLPDHIRSCLVDLFEQYTALGGNHGVGVLVEETLKLPPVKEGIENE